MFLCLTLVSGIIFAFNLSAADFDGDGTADIAIFRPNTGLWAIRGGDRVYFGSGTDKPVPDDYDGDGTDEIAVYRYYNGL